VLDAQAAAEVDHGRSPVELGAAVGDEGGEPVDARTCGTRLHQLRAEVDVDAGNLEPRLTRARDRRERDLGWEPELRAVVRSPDRRMRVGVDARRDAHEDSTDTGRAGALDLVLGVEDDEPGPRFRCGRQLLVALVVPVDDDPLAADPGPLREAELAERGDVGAEPLRREEPQHREVRERLDAVGEERAGRRGAVRPPLGENRVPAVDEERRPVLGREVGCAHAADRQLAAGLTRGIGKEFEHGGSLSQLLVPSAQSSNFSRQVKRARARTGKASLLGLFPIARPRTG
jgi:hypothetical protein